MNLYAQDCESNSDSCGNLGWALITYKKDLTNELKYLKIACERSVEHACKSYSEYYSKIAELVSQGYTYTPQDDKDKHKAKDDKPKVFY